MKWRNHLRYLLDWISTNIVSMHQNESTQSTVMTTWYIIHHWWLGPMTPYIPLNIVIIHNIDLIPATSLNIFWILLVSFTPLNICQPPLPSTHSYCPPLISTNSDNPHPISNILLPPSLNICQPPLTSTHSYCPP